MPSSKAVDNAVAFNLTTITAEEASVFLAGLESSDLRKISVGLSKIVSNCPREWGEPGDVQTYMQLPYFGAFKELVSQFRVVNATYSTDEKKPKIEFDLSTITVEEMDRFFAGIRKYDNEAISKTLAKLILKCPEDWGKPANYKTYLNLPYYGAFQQVIQLLVDEVNGKN